MFIVPAYGAKFYNWVDEKGVVHFTNEYKKVPPAFRNRMEKEEYPDEKSLSIVSQKMSTRIKEERAMARITGANRWTEQLRDTKKLGGSF